MCVCACMCTVLSLYDDRIIFKKCAVMHDMHVFDNVYLIISKLKGHSFNIAICYSDHY